MSINALTSDEIQRRRGPASVPGVLSPDTVPIAGTGVGGETNPVTNTLSALVKYIPTESVTLYVAALSALSGLREISSSIDARTVYLVFGVVLTPALVLLLLIAKLAADPNYNDPLPWNPRKWPWWKMIAASIAFLAWGLAVPNNPYIQTEGLKLLAAFAATFVSLILSIFGSIFERPTPKPMVAVIT